MAFMTDRAISVLNSGCQKAGRLCGQIDGGTALLGKSGNDWYQFHVFQVCVVWKRRNP